MGPQFLGTISLPFAQNNRSGQGGYTGTEMNRDASCKVKYPEIAKKLLTVTPLAI